MMLNFSLIMLVVATILQPSQSFNSFSHHPGKETEPRQIFRDDVEKLKNRPHRPAKPEFYEDEEYQPPSSYDLYQSDFESYFEPSYPNYPIDQEDDYYQKPNYKPSHRPSYHDKTNSKHRVPNYTPKPQTYQEDYQAYHSKPSYPSHESIYDRPEYDTPKYSNDYKNEHKYGNKYENDHSSGYSSGYENEHTNTKPYDDKYFKPEVYRTKPRPTYPKEVILLQPGPAVKAIPYQHKPEGYNSGAVPGTPGKDYPNYSYVPETSFKCPYQSDYEQMYSDPEAGCQVFHSCHIDGRQDSFLCPLGTIFDSYSQTCDWWFNTDCA